MNTKSDHIKSSLLCVVFYIFLIITLIVSRFFETRAHETYNVGYGYASTAIIILIFFILGILVTYISKHQKTNIRINIIEFIILGAPFIFMCFAYFYPFFSFNALGFNINEFTNNYGKELLIAGSVLFGCDIYALITSLKKKVK